MANNYCGEDCSARNAAIAAATAALKAAEALKKDIEQEQHNIDRLKGAYNSAKSTLINAGRSIATETNTAGLNESINCLTEYTSNLETAAKQCDDEVTRCKTQLQQAEAMTCVLIECQ